MTQIDILKNKILAGGDITADEAYSLLSVDRMALREAATEITRALSRPGFEFCSIINGRSGRCSENCKWCAQSAHYPTHCETYDLVDHETCLRAAHYSHSKQVSRFSFVASGRMMKGETLTKVCKMMADARADGIKTCASLGLLDRDSLQQLWDAGVHRYHCNLETAPSYFAKLCTTHTIDDKLKTIATARELGFEICSGGIIGMGETPRQRVELALTLRQVQPVSIPINILAPIPGTPLENTPLISEDEVLDTVAIFRFIHPTVDLRFAGGRARLSEETQRQAMKIGVNSAIVGDLLTTVGSTIDDDKQRIADVGTYLREI